MYKILAVGVILIAGVVLTACTPGEKVAETVIESQTNQDVDIDVDNDQVSINTDSTSLQLGESVELPDNFPSDVHVTDGTVTAAVATNENDGFSVQITSDQSVSDVKDEYQSALTDDGWDINLSMDINGGSSMNAEKDNRFVTVAISDVDGATQVTLTTGSND